MRILQLSIAGLLLLTIFFSCNNDISEEEKERLETVITDLRNQISQSDSYFKDFSKRYNLLLMSYDSISMTKDSLEESILKGVTFNSDTIGVLNSRLKLFSLEIDKLRSELAIKSQNTGASDFVNTQLDRMKELIEELELENNKLAIVNDSITNLLKNTRSDLVSTKSELSDVITDLSDVRAEAEKALLLQREKSEEEKRMALERQNMQAELEQLYVSATSKLEVVDDKFEFSSRKNEFKLKKQNNRTRNEVRSLLRDIVDILSQAKKNGHTKSRELLDELYRNSKYIPYLPIY